MTISLEKLNKMYEDAKRVDEKIFAEQRTNILLRSGDHYNKNNHKTYEQLRSRGVISKEQKIRLVKNNIPRITNEYENQILEGNPSVQAVPFNDNELHDVKAAEMNQAVIDWVKTTNNWPERQGKNVHDFVNIGEVFGIVRFDRDKGRLGEFTIDRVFGFDMKRDPNARSNDDTRWWIRDNMIDIEDFKNLVRKLNPEIDEEKIQASAEGTYKIFDNNSGEYREVKDQVLVKELFKKPCSKYPKGWYSMYTKEFDIYQAEIPFGIYPVVYGGFDELTTSPRSTSVIRVCRPYQVEINRSSSKMAEHQITLGDDKVYIQKGTKLSNGGYVHGVRAVQVSGKEPIIQAGRSGAQYLDYQLSQLDQMYQAANVAHLNIDQQPQTGDPYQLLYRSMKEKKRFVKYVTKYEQFEVCLFKTVLKMAKHYLTPEHVIRINGRVEAVNVPEFKRMDDSHFEIKVVPQSGDVETKFGKLLSITQILQYAAGQLDPDQIGGLIRNLPFGNAEQIFSSLTVDTDNATNDILALDRGDEVIVNVHDNHEFMIKSLSSRMKKSDFRFLNPKIQENYRIKLSQHELYYEQQQAAIAQANMGMIPSGGFLTTVNASWHNPTTNRVERIKIPSEAVQWLVQKLNTQGAYAQELSTLPEQAQAEIAAQVNTQAQSQAAQPIAPQARI